MLLQIFHIVQSAFEIYTYALIIYIFMSWFPGARESSLGLFLGRISEPYLEQFRRFIPPLGMIDISPLIAIIVLQFAARSGLPVLFQLLSGLF
jgi:YggT family protein